jgi:NhaA family Na+:H+ antiporter
VFALANAGVRLSGGLDALRGPVALGIVVGLVVGKPVGIVASTWLLVRITRVPLPDGITWPRLAAVGAIAGIGFTMSLFIAELAALDPTGHRDAKLGVLAATATATVIGWIAMRRTTRDARAGAAATPASDHRLG